MAWGGLTLKLMKLKLQSPLLIEALFQLDKNPHNVFMMSLCICDICKNNILCLLTVKTAVSFHSDLPFTVFPLGWGERGVIVCIFRIYQGEVELGLCHFNYSLERCFAVVALQK